MQNLRHSKLLDLLQVLQRSACIKTLTECLTTIGDVRVDDACSQIKVQCNGKEYNHHQQRVKMLENEINREIYNKVIKMARAVPVKVGAAAMKSP